MACSVAVSGASPVFSPSQRKISLGCKQSPETLSLQHDVHLPGGSPHANSSPSPSSSSSPFSSSPSRCRRRPGGSGLRLVFGDGCSTLPREALPKNGLPSSSDAITGTALKRKRPERIHIPAMESIDFTSRSSRGEEQVEFDSSRFAVFSKKGRRRRELEDRYKASWDEDSEMAFFGVFDGHGGTAAAEFAANNLHRHILEKINEQSYEEAVRTAYLKTDAEFLEKQTTGGASCVTAVITNGDLVVSNAGDCRAVMSSAGEAEALTSDHRPSREDERIRIENLGGYLDYRHGALRLHGSLAVSRGIGDGHLKEWVTAEPETRVLRIKPESEFLILASDGLWDKVSNQEAVDVARPLCLKSDKQSLLSACKELVHLSVDRGSADDVSVMIIPLRDSV